MEADTEARFHSLVQRTAEGVSGRTDSRRTEEGFLRRRATGCTGGGIVAEESRPSPQEAAYARAEDGEPGDGAASARKSGKNPLD